MGPAAVASKIMVIRSEAGSPRRGGKWRRAAGGEAWRGVAWFYNRHSLTDMTRSARCAAPCRRAPPGPAPPHPGLSAGMAHGTRWASLWVTPCHAVNRRCHVNDSLSHAQQPQTQGVREGCQGGQSQSQSESSVTPQQCTRTSCPQASRGRGSQRPHRGGATPSQAYLYFARPYVVLRFPHRLQIVK